MTAFFFDQYSDYSNYLISLELVAVFFGIFSVLLALKNNILVYPTGLVSTLLYVYILFEFKLYGDLIINIYYSFMSVYGWFLWSKKKNGKDVLPITRLNNNEIFIASIIFMTTLLFVLFIYHIFDKFTDWSSMIDALTTGLFFVGMWLMAKRKIENWILWIVADVISIPLYFYKGLTFSSFQFLIFTIIAVYAYIEWKKYLQKEI
ncbi:MAG TPA: nicotinamide mononucleotide transporter [Flavobacterium sp.]|nr:nicotinamide mononucleotide transporter [Flavobacterium sp.]